MMEKSGKRVTLKGELVYQFPQPIFSYCQDQVIIKIEIWGCHLLHRSYRWLATLIANILTLGTNDPIQHWWLVIHTKQAYYTMLKGNARVTMRRAKSLWEANQTGLYPAVQFQNTRHWKKKQCEIADPSKTMKWFTEMLSQMKIGEFDYLSCNCQDFALRAFKTIQEGKLCNETRIGNYPWLIPGTWVAYLMTGGEMGCLTKRL